MICPWCRYLNIPRAKFCGECGRSLAFDAACESCGTLNPTAHLYCDMCGVELTPTSEIARAPVKPIERSQHSSAPPSQVVQPRDPVRASSSTLLGWIGFLKLLRPGLVWDQPAIQWRWSWDHIVASISRNKVELAMVAILTIVAAILRIYRLAELPSGLHGDEALTGLDALRILEEGWIGVYVGSALGQPAGPLYLTALVFRVFEPTQFTLHLSMALLGVATIPAAYFLLRIGFGRWVAVFGTVALTFSYWHLFFSRSAFMLVSMPLMTTLAAAAILIALRTTTRWAWFAAGVVLGLGVYSYNGYLMFVVAVALLFVAVLILGRNKSRFYITSVGVLAAGFLIAAFPLIRLAYTEPDFYFQHHRTASVLREPKYLEAQTLSEKIDFFTGRAWDAATLPFSHDEIDYIDGLGGRGTMNPILALLAYAGLIISIAKWRSPPHLLFAVTFVLGLGIIILGGENWGELRRPLIVLPFAYGLAGVAAITGGRWVAGLIGGVRGKAIAYSGTTLILVVAIALNTWTYFGLIVHEEHLDWVYASDLVDALDAAHEFDQPGTIYFYSGRWSYDYETRRFLYPETTGIDRSREYGDFSLEKHHDGPVTYVLLPPYTKEVDALREQYPGGDTVEEYTTQGARRYSVYHLQ